MLLGQNILSKNARILNSNDSPEMHTASRKKLKNVEFALGELTHISKETKDLALKMRQHNLLADPRGEAYAQLSTEFFNRWFVENGATFSQNAKGETVVKYSKKAIADNALLFSKKTLDNVALATFDDTLLTTTNMIVGMYDQITPSNESPIMSQFPEALYPSVGLFIASWDPITGMTMERQLGQPFYNQPKRGVNYQYWKTQPFSGKITFYQEELIGLRDPSSNELFTRGLAMYMAKNQAVLVHQKQTRDIFGIYRSIYDGVGYYNGSAYSYNISPANRLTGTSLAGAPFATFDALGNLTGFNNVNLLVALRNLAHSVLKRYTGFELLFIMNSQTLSALISHPSITPVSTNFGTGMFVGGGSAVSGEQQFADILQRFLGTSAKIKVVIDDSQYYPDKNDPLGRPASTTQSYYLNDIGKIVICPQVQSTGAGMGEYAYTPTIQNGGLENAQPGPAYFMINTMGSNTVDGMENPTLSLALNYNAIPMIYRPQDLYTLDITQ